MYYHQNAELHTNESDHFFLGLHTLLPSMFLPAFTCLLLYMQRCCHIFVGTVVNKVQESLHSKQHYQEGGTKPENKQKTG